MVDSNRRPRILYVTQTLPHRVDFGGEIRCVHIARALHEIGDVEVAFLDDEHKYSGSDITRNSEFPVAHVFDIQPRLNRGLVDKINWTLNPHADFPNGCSVGPDASQRMASIARSYDLIWFFRLRAADVFPNQRWERSVVDIDDLPSTYERSALQVQQGFAGRFSARRRISSWQRRERQLGKRFSVLTVCSEDDKEYLEEMGVASPVHVVPNGFDKPLHEPVRNLSLEPLSLEPRIGFIGLFDFLPNRDGILWFIDNCWLKIKREIPNARLRLIGKDSDGILQSLGPEIDRLGWLADPAEEIKTWSAMIVPVRMGAGTRIKIAQAFSMKCPVVSTALGAHGYGAEDGHEMYLADSPENFANACVKVFREPEAAARMAERAWHQFLEKWTWDAIQQHVSSAVAECLQGAKA